MADNFVSGRGGLPSMFPTVSGGGTGGGAGGLGGGNSLKWLIDLITRARAGDAPSTSANLPGVEALAGLEPTPAAPLEPSRRFGRSATPAPPRGKRSVVAGMAKKAPAPIQEDRATRAIPEPVPAPDLDIQEDRATRARPEDAEPLGAPVVPPLNAPLLPEPAGPEAEPTGDAELWRSALDNPDLLAEAERGDMTSLELLKRLIASRSARPKLGGGLQ